MTREIQIGKIYRHFKNLYYIVEGVAKHSETLDEYVIYRKLYGDGSRWIREKSMFLSEVNHEKYPDVSEKYRFELLQLQGDHIFLRPWNEKDAEELFSLASDKNLSVIKKFFGKDGTCAIALKESGHIVGAIGDSRFFEQTMASKEGEPAIGYWISETHQNKGYETEAFQLKYSSKDDNKTNAPCPEAK
ncbi:MAG: GNAT family N-acetyltransferase [Fibrobacter sp.]|nr:GNAT family N-acetyltransferase [Fibrobacter sp.]